MLDMNCETMSQTWIRITLKNHLESTREYLGSTRESLGLTRECLESTRESFSIAL